MAVAAEEMRVFSGREGVVDWAGPHLGPNLPLLSQEQVSYLCHLCSRASLHVLCQLCLAVIGVRLFVL